MSEPYWEPFGGPTGPTGRGVPAGGSAGQVLGKVSGTDYDTAWQTAAKTFRTGHTWAVQGALTAITLPGFFIPEAAGHAVTLVSVRAVIASGTSIVVQITRNGSNLGSTISVTTTAGSTAFSQAITDLDLIGAVLSSPSGSPNNLSLTAILEHVV